MMQALESSVSLPQEVRTAERHCSSSVAVCLNNKGAGRDILLHIVTDTSMNIILAPSGFNHGDAGAGKVWTDAESDRRSRNRWCPGYWPSSFMVDRRRFSLSIKMMSACCQR